MTLPHALASFFAGVAAISIFSSARFASKHDTDSNASSRSPSLMPYPPWS